MQHTGGTQEHIVLVTKVGESWELGGLWKNSPRPSFYLHASKKRQKKQEQESHGLQNENKNQEINQNNHMGHSLVASMKR